MSNETQVKQKNSVMGRPTDYTVELADKIIETLETYPLSIESLRDLYDWFPSETTLWRWKHAHKDFRKRYIRAKKIQARLHIEQTIKIPDEVEEKLKTYDPKKANALVAAAKLRCDTRQWYASRLLPKEFAESKKVDAKINANVKTEKLEIDLSKFTEDELKLWRKLQEKAQVENVNETKATDAKTN